ncbi:class I adenylate-forming enzyme family protein [Williamsia soli]|uniref:class I adenylate-forming enzyme family protein n=1 Tax=Williamsia soli TaxID=364929 RepID=UPI001A9F13E3|nr:class I adenylate-forming enzyme family protein [Williamsia soli]
MKQEAGFLFRIAAQHHPDRIALTYKGSDLTFAELNVLANRFGSGLLQHGLSKGDRVAVLSYNRPELVQAWLGLEKFALVRTALHTHTPLEDQVELLKHVEARALVFDTAFADQIDSVRDALSPHTVFVAFGEDCPEWAVSSSEVSDAGSPEDPYIEVDENDACFLQLTSGTTGMSKPWVKTYRSWAAVITQNTIHLDTFTDQPAVDENDVNLHFHPLQWASGFQTLYPYLLRGARTVLLSDEEFDADEVVDLLIAEKVTGTFAPGPLLSAILDVLASRGSSDLSLKRIVVFFGSKDLLERTTSLIGPIWAHGFGATEQGAVTTRLLPSDVANGGEHRLESVGRPASPNIEIATVDPEGRRLPARSVGEIVVRSAMSDGRYWGLADKTEAAYFPNDWFRSGDVGYIDSDGYLFYGDRAGDTIRLDDNVIYPHIIEASLLAHEDVANCGVVYLEGDRQPSIVAAVTLKPRRQATDDLHQALKVLTSAHLSEVAVPGDVVFLDELPTVLGGAKVQRGALRVLLQEAP